MRLFHNTLRSEHACAHVLVVCWHVPYCTAVLHMAVAQERGEGIVNSLSVTHIQQDLGVAGGGCGGGDGTAPHLMVVEVMAWPHN